MGNVRRDCENLVEEKIMGNKKEGLELRTDGIQLPA